MYVDDGRVLMLTSELGYIAGLKWGLFTTNVADAETNNLASYTEAAWSGYARVTVGPMQAASLVAGRAVSQPVTNPSFGNTSGVNQQFYGWLLIDASANKLVAAVNLGIQNIANGATYPLAPVFSKTDG